MVDYWGDGLSSSQLGHGLVLPSHAWPLAYEISTFHNANDYEYGKGILVEDDQNLQEFDKAFELSVSSILQRHSECSPMRWKDPVQDVADTAQD